MDRSSKDYYYYCCCNYCSDCCCRCIPFDSQGKGKYYDGAHFQSGKLSEENQIEEALIVLFAGLAVEVAVAAAVVVVVVVGFAAGKKVADFD